MQTQEILINLRVMKVIFVTEIFVAFVSVLRWQNAVWLHIHNHIFVLKSFYL